MTYYEVEKEHVGYDGNEESDIGRYCVVIGSVTYWRDNESAIIDLIESVK